MDFQVAILVRGTWKPLHPYTNRFSSLHLSNNFSCRRKGSHRSTSISSRLENSQQPQQQLNLSVLRFTFGIPGLDESYLPRYIGVSFGSLLLLNHFAASTSLTSAQFRSEVLGLCLAAFSVSLPYIGKFLKLISVQDALCVRGYWIIREDASKADILDWFREQIQQIGFSDLKDTLYFPQGSEYQAWEILPKGALSFLVQPLLGSLDPTAGGTKLEGFILLVSNVSNAYSEKDRAWIRAIAKKIIGWITSSLKISA